MKRSNEEILFDTAELFKVFGDSTRIRILNLLLEKDELNVTEISEQLNMNQSAISHQLRILKDAKLIKSRRIGKMILYSLDDKHVNDILRQGINHTKEK